jgi:hypothetical protein
LTFEQREDVRQQCFEDAISLARGLLIRRGVVRSSTLQRGQILIEATVSDRIARGERDAWTLARYAVFTACAELNLTTPLRVPVAASRPPRLRVITNRSLPVPAR